MNKYVRKLFRVMFQSQQTQQVVHIQSQSSPISPEEWREHWQAKGFPWRTEPEIDAKRQEELSKCRAIDPDTEKGIYPFKGMKLSRADVEWLLATHANGRGPVNWNDEKQREREGLDVRGVDLRQVDLSGLPLTRLRGGPSFELRKGYETREEQRTMAVLHMEGAILQGARLEGANLNYAQLEGADLGEALLQGADLRVARLEGADLRRARLEGALLNYALLKRAILQGAQLERADLRYAHIQGAYLQGAQLNYAQLQEANLNQAQLNYAQLQEANLNQAQLEGAILFKAHLRGANLGEAQLEGANLDEAQLEGANLFKAHLPVAYLYRAHLQGANLYGADLTRVRLEGANLQEAILVEANLREADLRGTQLKGANLERVTLGNEKQVGPQLVDCQWGDVNLAVIKWSQVKILGDEYVAQQKEDSQRESKDKQTRVDEYEAAVRANRQLAIALQSQGLDEDAAHFAFRAKVLQRKVYWHQIWKGQVRQLGAYLFSWFLALLTGYGYRMWRILVAYLILILAFSFAYWGVGAQHPGDLSFWQALIVSVTAFHGRVFTNPFTSGIPDAQSAITAIEAVVGLIIEGVFIAMLVQRFFGK